MIITIEERGLRNQVNIDDDADSTQMRTAFSRLLIARGHTFGDEVDGAIIDDYEELYKQDVVKDFEKANI